MRVLFCGTSSGGNSFQLDRANASLLIEHDTTAVLLDCGGGSLRQLIAGDKSLSDITAIAISHLHHDHVLGLAELFGRLIALNAGTPPPVYGPRGIADFMERVRELVRPLARREESAVDAVHGEELAPGHQLTIGTLQLEPFEVQHAPNLQSFGWRASAEGKTVVYSGDTAAVDGIMVSATADSDLLIHDAFSTLTLERLIQSRRGDPALQERLRTLFPRIHGVATEVGRLATAAHVARLVSTSISPFEDVATLEAEVRSGYSGRLSTAEDGLVLTV